MALTLSTQNTVNSNCTPLTAFFPLKGAKQHLKGHRELHNYLSPIEQRPSLERKFVLFYLHSGISDQLPVKKWTNAYCSHSQDYLRTGGPTLTFFFQWFFQLLSSATWTVTPECPGSKALQLCPTQQLRKGKGWGCLQGEVTQESAFTILLTLGQGQPECTFQQKHQVATGCHPAKVHGSICGGKTDRFLNGECLPHHVLEPASAPGNQSTQRNIQQ